MTGCVFTKRSHAVMCGIFVFLLFVAVDQCAKIWILAHERAPHLCNYGVAFGITLPQSVFVILWACVMALVFYLWRAMRDRDVVVHLAFVAISAGALSNVIDRIWHGCVIDYVPFFQISSYNFADFLITCGAIVLIWKSRGHT